MEQHDAIVSDIARRVRHFYDCREKFRIYHGSTNSTRSIKFQPEKMVDTSALNHVLKIDPRMKTALVEPNVPMDRLVEETLKHGLIPPVVMEFPGITVGGGFAGTGGESSSFKYGFFDRIVNWLEVVLANGDIVKASETERSDLFRGSAGTFGTLGVATLFELQLMDAATFVELRYQPVASVPEAQLAIDAAVADNANDFVDGIMFSLKSGAIMIGRLTDTAPVPSLKTVRFTRSYDPWFYVHAGNIIKKNKTECTTELVPLVDYLFRYDRGAFWTGRLAFSYFRMPFNSITRWLLDYFMHTRVMYHAMHKSGQSQHFIIQDLALPNPKAEEFIRWMDRELDIYPLWLCPIRQYACNTMQQHAPTVSTESSTSETILNIGVWGPCPSEDFFAENRKLEAKLRSLDGMKWLYAHTYYTETEFWEIYDKEWYDSLRAKYDATSLPTVFDKVKADATAGTQDPKKDGGIWNVWPLNGLYSVFSALFGRDYLKGK